MELVTHSTEKELLNLFMFSLKHTQPQNCNVVRRSEGTVVEEKLLVLNISQSELGPSDKWYKWYSL